MVQRTHVISLYRSLVRNANKFHNYNFREFAKRKINYEFDKYRSITDSAVIQERYIEGTKELEVLKRQVIINSLFPEENSVIENRYQK